MVFIGNTSVSIAYKMISTLVESSEHVEVAMYLLVVVTTS